MGRRSEEKQSQWSFSLASWWPRPIVFLPFVLLLGVAFCVADESSNCLMVYKNGGAPAVSRSPKCARWRPPAEYHRADCHVASLQGRRRSQEDRAFCALNSIIPFPGRNGLKEINVGLVAVFDGHNGDEASEMASKLLSEYFFLHLYFILDGIYTIALKKASGRLLLDGEKELTVPGFDWSWNSNNHAFDFERSEQMLSRVFDKSFHLEILKESLLRTVHDIDAAFSKEAHDKKLEAGSTATIIIKADSQVLVANIGDSKALLCSECLSSCHNWKYIGQGWRSDTGAMRRKRKYKLSYDGDSTCFCVKELTEDHHPDRNDERSRVEAAGGHVVEWGGVSRVNGKLAVSRAIGDVSFKSYGVIPVPEVTEWQTLSDNDTYIVAATDGVFEKLTAQDICDIIWASHKGIKEIPNANVQSVADSIVNRAFEIGSMDNMAAVVVPLQSADTSSTFVSEDSDLEGDAYFTLSNQNQPYGSDGSAINSSLISMDYLSWILANIDRILVRGRDHTVSCFHLYENLKEERDYVFQLEDYKKKTFHLQQAAPKALDLYHGVSPIYLHSDSKLCVSFQLDLEEDKGHCVNPEGFLGFLSLIGSVPLHDGLSNASDSSGYDSSAFRYILRKKFNRGSFGEVWLAYQSNCSKGGLSLKFRKIVDGYYHGYTSMSLDEDGCVENSSSASHTSDLDMEDLYILKRIMVERGHNAYLSGLREKYFGEIFLNASVAIKASASICFSNDLTRAKELNQLLQRNDSDLFEQGRNWNSASTCVHKSGTKIGENEGLDHIARYVESFESPHNELWLVFQNEGQSLSKLIYTTETTRNGADNEGDENTETIQIMRPSSWWHWLRKRKAGQEQLRSLIWQLLLALKSCHERNITHRDIKPENMVICLEDRVTGKCLKGYPSDANMYNIKLRIIDFGSAVNEFTINHLYGFKGPSRLEETVEYTSPEAMLNISWSRGSPDIILKYDMWSVGVVMMELILGSPHVFQISSRTRYLLDQYLDGWTMETRELAYKLRAFMEMCILVPGGSPLHQSTGAKGEHGASWLASWKCTEEAFSEQVKARDPLKLGFPDIQYLRLARQLLIWHPADRLSVVDALQHPYFHPHFQR